MGAHYDKKLYELAGMRDDEAFGALRASYRQIIDSYERGEMVREELGIPKWCIEVRRRRREAGVLETTIYAPAKNLYLLEEHLEELKIPFVMTYDLRVAVIHPLYQVHVLYSTGMLRRSFTRWAKIFVVGRSREQKRRRAAEAQLEYRKLQDLSSNGSSRLMALSRAERAGRGRRRPNWGEPQILHYPEPEEPPWQLKRDRARRKARKR